MRPWTRIAAIAAVALVSGYFVANGLAVDEAPLVPPPPPAAATVTHPDIPSIELHATSAAEIQPGRNVFAYVVHEAPPAPPVVRQLPPPEVPLRAFEPAEEAPAAPAQARFTWRFIGRFGPKQNPLAVFAREGEIVTARQGQKIDDRFVLRAIGNESVEVQPEGEGVQRIPLT
ncbi:MAG TPA: hypothetical protein VF618_09845 [Thermoanaerobaculia bacterium]